MSGRPRAEAASPLDLAAIAVCTLAWGTTWFTVTLQLGVVDPLVSLVYRLALATGLLFLWCAARKEPVAMTRRQHGLMAGLGLFGFTFSYAFTYLAETRVVSAVVAVLFAALAFLNLLTFHVALGHRAKRSAWAASALGVTGVALLSWGEIAGASRASAEAGRALEGIGLAIGGVVATAVGNVFAHRGEEAEIPLAPSTAWATLYGTLFLLGFVFATGRAWTFEPTARYVLSLAYLASIGSVVAFLAYFHVARSRGYTTASYILAMTPILAMVMSTLFEGKSWHFLGLAGVLLVLLGQWMLLRR